MRLFGLLLGAGCGILALTALAFLNKNYEFATDQITQAGPHSAIVGLMILALLGGLAALAIAALATIFRKTRPSAVRFVLAFLCAGGVASFLQSFDPDLISGLLGLPVAG